ncbi:P-loop containing nucleoside triphosphate hydrolase protein [Aspergillus avenaceus]|uniref:P-loop containing nucleoside triphosphate hydrolase protein n=1 Tax=Aspergillus avenaceus TaxID=36643 RepID=A0A5N6TSI1_ASPAV|nr:P-loop containing nucleoside triphosphate hydrolase protein [Aspergillus avenaceus]
MSREIDRLIQPAASSKPKKMKVIIPSCSRTGTLGLLAAMRTLGYTPYHMTEACFSGNAHMKILEEGVIAQHNRFSGIKRYERPDFDKWLRDFDCFIELPSYLGQEALEVYAQDPDVKFILTERDPDKWVKSVNSTVAKVVSMANSFPVNILKHFESTLFHFFRLNVTMYRAISDATSPGDPENEAALRRNYVEYIKLAKSILPEDRLLVVKLEDGLGWEQICPFLGLPIPDQEYPRGNEPEKFQKLVESHLGPKLQAATLRLGSLVVGAVGIAGYVWWKYL